MKVYLGVVAKRKEAFLADAEAEYIKRLRPFCTFELVDAPDEASLVKKLPPNARVTLWDERGRALTSMEFANDIVGHHGMHGGGAPLAFLIGDADGHSDELRSRATHLLSFGKMTIAHRLVRVLVLEQIYRGFTILQGLPYHREG